MIIPTLSVSPRSSPLASLSFPACHASDVCCQPCEVDFSSQVICQVCRSKRGGSQVTHEHRRKADTLFCYVGETFHATENLLFCLSQHQLHVLPSFQGVEKSHCFTMPARLLDVGSLTEQSSTLSPEDETGSVRNLRLKTTMSCPPCKSPKTNCQDIISLCL